MKLFGTLEVPNIFGNVFPFKPPIKGPFDNRPVADVVERPFMRVYDPNSLSYPDTMMPTLPGDGGNRTAGLGQVAVLDRQWDRGDLALAGPVRAVVGAMQRDRARVLGW